jgi:PAS domain S-box-containing protein
VADAARQDWQSYYDRGLRGDSFRIVTETAPPLAPRFVEYHFNPIVTSDGRVIGVTVWGTDITEHKQAEAELRGSEEHYRFLVDHLPAGLLVHGADGRTILSNPKASDLLGLSAAQMQGKPVTDPIWQFVREDTSPMPVDEYPAQRVFTGRQPVSNQVVGIQRPATGQYVWMLAHAFPDFDPQGQVRQAVVMLTDITRRKQTEAALQSSEVRYRDLYRSAQRQTLEMSLLDQVRAVVAGELDLATVIRKVVEAIAETFSYPLVSLYLRQGDSMVLRHQVGYDNVLEEIPISKGVLGKVMRTGQPALLGDVHADPDFLAAVPGITSEACVPLFDGGRVVGALNIESKSFELTKADLRLLAALGEQIGLALGRARLYTQVREDAATRAILLHEVNHRVKNNLSAIIGLLQIQQEHMPAEVQAGHSQLFDDLTGRIRSLAAVHDLLSAASWAPLLIHDLASRIVQATVAIAPPQPDIVVDIPPSPVQVTAKLAGPLALIINELATNSLKYALPQTPALRLGLEIRQKASHIELEYRDNGPGFPPAVLRGEQHNVGLHLIELLGRHDLRGKIDLMNDGGAVVRLSFRAEGGEALAPSPTGPLSISGPLP